jgi:hypothetical protein
MDKSKQKELRKLRKKAIRIQNQSPIKLSMAEAMKRASQE